VCTLPLLTRHRIMGTPANFSGWAPRQVPLMLAGCPQLLAKPSGGHGANVSGSALITRRCFDRGGDNTIPAPRQRARRSRNADYFFREQSSE